MQNLNALKSLPIVGVMGSGSENWVDRSVALGRWLATIDVHLLTGGGKGLMESVSRAFTETAGRNGMVIGVIPGQFDEASNSYITPAGYPNQFVEIPLFTHLPYSGDRGKDQLSRNHINVLSSNIIVILPGQSGTAAEAELAVIYNKPVVAWLETRSQIMNLHPHIPVVEELAQVKEFVLRQTRKLYG